MVNYITLRLSRLLLITANRSCTAILRHSSAAVTQQKLNIVEKNIIDYESYLHISKPGSTPSKDAIVQMLHFSNKTVNDITKQYPKLKEISPKDIIQNYQILLNSGVQKSVIRQNVYLLGHSADELQEKLNMIKQLGLEINDGIMFAKLSLKMLSIFLKYCEKDKIKPVDKIKAFCELLQEDMTTICTLFQKNRHLRSQSLVLLKRKIQLLLDNGFTPSAIIADGTSLSYTINKISKNLALISKFNIQKKKLWMIRSSEYQLEKYAVRFDLLNKYNGKIISLNDYVAQRLSCDKETVNYLILRNPIIARMSINKIKKVFDILDEFEIRPDQILIASQLFTRSVKTLKKRLITVKKKFGSIPNSISFLYMSHETFNSFINNCQ